MIWVILGASYLAAAAAFYSVSMRTAQAEVQLVVLETSNTESKAA